MSARHRLSPANTLRKQREPFAEGAVRVAKREFFSAKPPNHRVRVWHHRSATYMSKLVKRSRLKVAGAFALLCGVAFLTSAMVGCNGFFVDPTLSSLTITPSTPALQNI